MKNAYDKLCDAIETYLNANDYRPDLFKLQFTEDDEGMVLRDALRAAMDQSIMPPAKAEQLTDAAFDTQESVDTWLTGLWTYVYEDGPKPGL